MRTRARWLPALAGAAALLLAWWAVSAAFFEPGGVVPTPWAVLAGVWDDRAFYPPNVEATASAAAKGFVAGNLLAVALALTCVAAPRTEAIIMPFAVVAYSMPLIAIAPILVVLFGGDTPSVVLAALSVFFTTLIGAHLGLRSADGASLDLVRVCGGGRLAQLRKVRLWACLPALFGALRIAAPSALLGAMLGEFIGRDRGLGIALVVAQQNADGVRTWGIAVVATALAGLAYAAIALAGRLAVPWQAGVVSRP